jgi:hypothetical protein
MGLLGHRPSELRHNIEACLPSQTTSPLLLLIVNPIRRKTLSPPARASDAHSAVGRRARKTDGLVTAGTNGTRSTRAGCAPPAFISGLRRSAYRAKDGRRIRLGTRNDLLIRALKVRFEAGNRCGKP